MVNTSNMRKERAWLAQSDMHLLILTTVFKLQEEMISKACFSAGVTSCRASYPGKIRRDTPNSINMKKSWE